MKRRDALKSIVVVAAGVVIFPACQDKDPFPVYENLTIEREQFNLIGHLADALLPYGELEIKNPERTKVFILNMVNDCHSPEEREEYVEGLKAFELFVKEKYNKPFTEIETPQKQEIFEHISKLEGEKNPLRSFYETTRGYTTQHFTGSEYFLTNHLEWKFVPGLLNYQGCVKV